MIRRIVCLLLVAVMLANQGLLFAHVHHAAGGPEPAGHDSRSHVHLGGHHVHGTAHVENHETTHSHHHGDRDRASREQDGGSPSGIVPFGDHDANAIYGAETVALARDEPTTLACPEICLGDTTGFRVADQRDDRLSGRGPIRGQPASIFDAACPIYLRTLSLRI